MADLTSKITLSGTINGRTISMTNTMTIATVLDAAHREGRVNATATTEMMKGTGGAGTGPAPPVNYGYPAFACCVNKSVDSTLKFQMYEATSGKFISVLLRAGDFFSIASNGTNGCWTTSAVATTITMIDNDKFSVQPNDESYVDFDVMAAYK